MRLYTKEQVKLIVALILFLTVSFFLFEKGNLYAQSSTVEASVKISICGNEVVEGGEDCEPTTFTQLSCSDLGYEGGEVYCDNSCSYDTYECIIPQPPEPEPPTEEEIIEQIIEDVVNRKEPIIIVAPTLPYLKLFDFDGNGIIDDYEFRQSVLLWGKYWRQYRQGEEELSCDLNDDTVCDIVDFSILLYHTK
jgi:hypothetical protein